MRSESLELEIVETHCHEEVEPALPASVKAASWFVIAWALLPLAAAVAIPLR